MVIIGGKTFIKCSSELYNYCGEKKVFNYLLSLDKVVSFSTVYVYTEHDKYVIADEELLKQIGKYLKNDNVENKSVT